MLPRCDGWVRFYGAVSPLSLAVRLTGSLVRTARLRLRFRPWGCHVTLNAHRGRHVTGVGGMALGAPVVLVLAASAPQHGSDPQSCGRAGGRIALAHLAFAR